MVPVTRASRPSRSCSQSSRASSSSGSQNESRTRSGTPSSPGDAAPHDPLPREQVLSHIVTLPPHPDHGLKYIPTKCPHCDYKPTTRSKYKAHVANVHEHVRPVKCPDCETRFANRHALLRHHEGVHQKLKPFACEWPGCGHRSSQKQAVTFHVRTVHLKEFTMLCHWCSKGFNHKNSLRVHMLKHTSEGHDIDDCHICTSGLSWTPGRGKRAKMEDPPATLAIRYPKKHQKTLSALVPLYLIRTHVNQDEPDLPGTPLQIKKNLPILIPKPNQQQDHDWDDAMNQFFNWKSGDTIAASKSTKRLKAAAAEQQQEDVDCDEEGEDRPVTDCNNNQAGEGEREQKPSTSGSKRRRASLFMCKHLNCTFMTKDQGQLMLHMESHSSSGRSGNNSSCPDDDASHESSFEEEEELDEEQVDNRSYEEEDEDVDDELFNSKAKGKENRGPKAVIKHEPETKKSSPGKQVPEPEFSEEEEDDEEEEVASSQDPGSGGDEFRDAITTNHELISEDEDEEDEVWADAKEIADSMYLDGLPGSLSS